MRALILALALLFAAPAAQAQTPQNGPFYQVGTSGWEVYWDNAAWVLMFVYGDDVVTESRRFETEATGWYPLAFTPKAGRLCDVNTCWQNSDIDPWLDFWDNCLLIPNEQADFDNDDWGNACDGDFDNSGTVNVTDFNVFSICNNLAAANGGAVIGHVAGINCHNVDMDTSGTINTTDFNLWIPQFNAGVPGP